MAGNNANLCSVCLRKVPSNARKLKCDCCLKFIHKNCSNLLKKELDEIIFKNRSWSCLNCNENNVPFNNISDNEPFYATIGISHNSEANLTCNKLFVPFEINDNDYTYQDIESDPDLHFYSENQIISNLNSIT